MCSRNAEEIEQAAREIAELSGRRVLGLCCDVTEESQVSEPVGRTLEEFGKVDILIDNAGMNICDSIEDLCLDEFDQVMDVNFRAVAN